MTGTLTQHRTDAAIQEPSLYNVIYVNDDQTPVEFVIDSLCNVFDYNIDTANKIAQDVQLNGSAVVAVLPFEIAEQKGIEVTVSARQSNFPLMLKIEPGA